MLGRKESLEIQWLFFLAKQTIEKCKKSPYLDYNKDETFFIFPY